ncbi:hypothetical protein [Clostridium sp.]|uniref:hypothetical protein n=1 Tax=Clostridium sp. TaxID=1506 RepID=UPI003992722B
MVKRVAERRMFSKTIIDSDLFLDMSLSTQALYFHLSMRADDDGFVNNPKKVQRMIGAGDDELKMLIAKQFIIPFESGICVIKHWRIHNFIRNDRYKQTLYTDELARLELTKSKDYELRKNVGIPSDNQVDTDGIPLVNKRDTQVSIELGKDRIGKDSLSSSSKSNEEEELLEVLRICQKIAFRLKKVDAKDFINIYGAQKVKQALITISHSSSNISSPAAYLAATLQDLGRGKTVNVNINKNTTPKQLRFQNHDQRDTDYDAMEDELVGWPDDDEV